MRSTHRHRIHQLFVPLVILTLILWYLYRRLFDFPVWFDETIGKAIFFGIPVWLYITTTGFRPIVDTFKQSKMRSGLLKGLAIGGMFGFATLFIRLAQTRSGVIFVPVYMADRFWLETLLAMFTAFWETLFFYCFVMTVIQERYDTWTLHKQITLVVLIFLLFHIPNIFSRFLLVDSYTMILLLTLFATGQGLLFARNQNAYTLVISHIIWGLSLLIYF